MIIKSEQARLALLAQKSIYERSAQSNQKHLNGKQFITDFIRTALDEPSDNFGKVDVINNRVCYRSVHYMFNTEKQISLPDMLANLPFTRFWNSGNPIDQRPWTNCATFDCGYCLDAAPNAFDLMNLYDQIMDVAVKHCNMNARSCDNQSWRIALYVLNNYDCYADEVIRNQFKSGSGIIAHQIAAAFVAAISDQYASGLFMSLDDEMISIYHVDHFIISFTQHLWELVGSIAYNDGDDYEWSDK